MKTIFKPISIAIFLVAGTCFIGITLVDVQTQFGYIFEFILDTFIFIMGIFVVVIYQRLVGGTDKKSDLIDPQKLAQEIARDEKRQLEEKVKTLEAALSKLLK
ncbi:MAG: hypothetical protein SFT81_06950 [Candidatus Caenarcaniphilales bacterium]|nr:hypothetical protein [Candidatus Caenarcaniphilales bacterium]